MIQHGHSGAALARSHAVAMVKLLGFGPRVVQPRTAFDYYSARDEEDDYDADYEEMTRCALQVILDDVDRALFDDCPRSRAGCEAASAVYVTEAQAWRRALPHLRARGHSLHAPAGRIVSEGGGCSADGATGTSRHAGMLPPAYGVHGGGEVQGEDEDDESMGAGSTGEEWEDYALQRPTHPLAYVPLVLAVDFGGLIVRGTSCPLTADGLPGPCLSTALGRCSFRDGGGGEVACRHAQATGIDTPGQGNEYEEEVIAAHGILEETITADRTRPPPLPATPVPVAAIAAAAAVPEGGNAMGRSPIPEVIELRLAGELGLPPRSPMLAIRHHVISEIADRCWHALMPLLSLLPELVAHQLQAHAGWQHASRRTAELRVGLGESRVPSSCHGGMRCAAEVQAVNRAGSGMLAPRQASTDSDVLARGACLAHQRLPAGSPLAPSLPVAPGHGSVQHPPFHAPPRMSIPLVLAPSFAPASRSVAQLDEAHGGCRPPASLPLRLVRHSPAPNPRQSARRPLNSLSSEPRTAGMLPRPRGTTPLAIATSRNRCAPLHADVQPHRPPSLNRASAGEAPLVSARRACGWIPERPGPCDGGALLSHPHMHADRKGRPPPPPDRGVGRGSPPMGRARSSAGGSVLDSHRGWSEGGASVHGQAVRRGALPPGRWPLPALHT